MFTKTSLSLATFVLFLSVFILIYVKEGYIVGLFLNQAVISGYISSVLTVIVLTEFPHYRNEKLKLDIAALGSASIPSLKVDKKKCVKEGTILSRGEEKIICLLKEALNHCKTKYCLIVEDDFYFFYRGLSLQHKLFAELHSNFSNENLLYDCSKFGLLNTDNYVNGNTLSCRILNRKIIDDLKICIENSEHDRPADLLYKKCLSGKSEKRFLLGNTIDKFSLKENCSEA